MQCCWAHAFYHLNPGFLLLLGRSSILWVAVLSMMFFVEERPLLHRPAFWLGAALAVAGVVGVIVCREDFRAGGAPAGIVLVLSSSLFWALYTVSVRAAFREPSSHQSFAVISLYTVAGLAVAWALFSDAREFASVPGSAWLAVVVSAILCIAGAHTCYYGAIKRLGSTIPSIPTSPCRSPFCYRPRRCSANESSRPSGRGGWCCSPAWCW